MDIITEKFTITSSGFDDTIDITQKIKTIVSNTNAKEGIVIITSPLPTVSFMRMENTKGTATDIKNIFSTLVPIHRVYEHDNNWYDGNAFSHLKSALAGNSLTLAIYDGFIELNRECTINMVDFNNKMGQIPVVTTVLYKTDKKDDRQQ